MKIQKYKEFCIEIFARTLFLYPALLGYLIIFPLDNLRKMWMPMAIIFVVTPMTLVYFALKYGWNKNYRKEVDSRIESNKKVFWTKRDGGVIFERMIYGLIICIIIPILLVIFSLIRLILFKLNQ